MSNEQTLPLQASAKPTECRSHVELRNIAVAILHKVRTKKPGFREESRAGESICGDQLEPEMRLAWVAPFLSFFCLIQLMVERSFSPVFSIG